MEAAAASSKINWKPALDSLLESSTLSKEEKEQHRAKIEGRMRALEDRTTIGALNDPIADANISPTIVKTLQKTASTRSMKAQKNIKVVEAKNETLNKQIAAFEADVQEKDAKIKALDEEKSALEMRVTKADCAEKEYLTQISDLGKNLTIIEKKITRVEAWFAKKGKETTQALEENKQLQGLLHLVPKEIKSATSKLKYLQDIILVIENIRIAVRADGQEKKAPINKLEERIKNAVAGHNIAEIAQYILGDLTLDAGVDDFKEQLTTRVEEIKTIEQDKAETLKLFPPAAQSNSIAQSVKELQAEVASLKDCNTRLENEKTVGGTSIRVISGLFSFIFSIPRGIVNAISTAGSVLVSRQ